MTSNADVHSLIRADLASATAASKCHGCGCFHDAIAALGASSLKASLADLLDEARRSLGERRYDCLGCPVCFPADALNHAAQVTTLPAGAGCPTDLPSRREGWPPYPGEYRTLRYAAPVAVCTLHSRELVDALAAVAPEGLSIVGALQTENLGIERIIENVVANPHLRVLLVCGEDTPGRVGHFPGQTLVSLVERGVDERGRIIDAAGKRPLLRNLRAELIEHFRGQIQLLDLRGLVDVDAIARRVRDAAVAAPGPVEEPPAVSRSVRTLQASAPERLILDPAGYVVVVPDRRRRRLVAEHYDNHGVLHTLVEGRAGVEVLATLLREGLVTRADHAGYLGRELALAERALKEGTAYVQDAAPGDPPSRACGCDASGGCS
jgi:tetrahydromethanopterin S-methyltransferase subunit A